MAMTTQNSGFLVSGKRKTQAAVEPDAEPAPAESKPGVKVSDLEARLAEVQEKINALQGEIANSPEARLQRLMGEAKRLQLQIESANALRASMRRRMDPAIFAEMNRLETEWQVLNSRKVSGYLQPAEGIETWKRMCELGRKIKQLREGAAV